MFNHFLPPDLFVLLCLLFLDEIDSKIINDTLLYELKEGLTDSELEALAFNYLNHILVTYYYTVKAFCLQGFIYSKVISSI